MSKLFPVFVGMVKNGEFVADDQDGYSVWMTNLDGKLCSLTIGEKKNQRTMNQNKYYNGVVLKIIGQHLGYERDEVHEILSAKFLKKMLNVGGNDMVVVKSTTSLTTEEMSHYIEKCKRFAAVEFGCFIPEPEDIK
jgi:hypothetical protein